MAPLCLGVTVDGIVSGAHDALTRFGGILKMDEPYPNRHL